MIYDMLITIIKILGIIILANMAILFTGLTILFFIMIFSKNPHDD